MVWCPVVVEDIGPLALPSGILFVSGVGTDRDKDVLLPPPCHVDKDHLSQAYIIQRKTRTTLSLSLKKKETKKTPPDVKRKTSPALYYLYVVILAQQQQQQPIKASRSTLWYRGYVRTYHIKIVDVACTRYI